MAALAGSWAPGARERIVSPRTRRTSWASSHVLTVHGSPDTDDVTMPTDARQEDAAALIARIARGDREAFSLLYDALAGAAFGLIKRVLRDTAASEDVLQEVFWQVWREASRYDPGRSSPEAWILMRAKSRAIDRLRSIRRRDRTFVGSV